MLQTTNLSKNYAGAIALENLNLHIRKGEIFCLLGANGAGKSTTINLFLNFIEASSGELIINGINVKDSPLETKKFLSYIPENLMLYPQLTGFENLEYFSGLSGKSYSKIQLREFLAEAGLQQEAHLKRVEGYSKGMRQKVGIAIAIAKKAEVLLLDEPTSGLDPQASNEFSVLLKRLQEKGVAILMATHDLFRAKEIGTHIGIMKQGKLIKSFKTSEVSLDELESLYLESIKI